MAAVPYLTSRLNFRLVLYALARPSVNNQSFTQAPIPSQPRPFSRAWMVASNRAIREDRCRLHSPRSPQAPGTWSGTDARNDTTGDGPKNSCAAATTSRNWTRSFGCSVNTSFVQGTSPSLETSDTSQTFYSLDQIVNLGKG